MKIPINVCEIAQTSYLSKGNGPVIIECEHKHFKKLDGAAKKYRILLADWGDIEKAIKEIILLNKVNI